MPDPFGGSYHVEALTSTLEAGARHYIRTIDEMGGMIPAIENGYPQAEISRASYEFQQKIERGEAVIVGVNKFQSTEDKPIDTLRIDQRAGDQQCEKLRRLRASRNNEEVTRTLNTLRRAAGTKYNLMPPLLDAVRSYATLGEICDVFRDVFGTWEERPSI